MRAIFEFLGLKNDPVDTDSQTIRRIADELDRLEPDRARYVAAFAFLLSRIARADQEVTADETDTMERLVSDHAGLSPEQSTLAVQMAKAQHLLFGHTDDFLVTRELGRVTTYEQRVAIIDCLHAVAAADHKILNAEATEIGRTARELKVEQPDLSRIRAKYGAHIEARKGLEG
jgi:uncharacterized tellurite resistance protein B-like protein